LHQLPCVESELSEEESRIVPWYPVFTLPSALTAFTVTDRGTPALTLVTLQAKVKPALPAGGIGVAVAVEVAVGVGVAVAVGVGVAVAASLTVTAGLVPVMEEIAVSVTVIVWLPAMLNVTDRECWPASAAPKV
jgi:hypothetical protein